jgi:ornithine carbamoyltransferase
MSDIVMIRTFEQTIIERFAEYSRVPVINGLTNEYHPCQILADIFTFIEHRGPIQGKTVAWVGTRTTCATPGCRPPSCLISRCMCRRRRATRSSPSRRLRGTDHFVRFDDPMEACRGADLVTTDVWTSMGFEAENEERMRDFADWQVDADMMQVANPGAVFMHCLPAHRGEEVSAEVIDGPQSVVWEEAENRCTCRRP